jgi:hypothetical protein
MVFMRQRQGVLSTALSQDLETGMRKSRGRVQFYPRLVKKVGK